MGKVYVDDLGTVIKLDTKVDVSGATEVEIRYKKEDGSTGTWTAIVDPDETTKIKHTITEKKVAGDYSLQAYVKMTSWEGLGETVQLIVYDRYK